MKIKSTLFTAALILGFSIAGLANASNDLIQSFIADNELGTTGRVETKGNNKVTVLTETYVLYEERKSRIVLMEFSRPCSSLRQETLEPDLRDGSMNLRAGDSYRGCRIKRFYRLSKDQLDALVTMIAGSGK